MVKDNQTLIHRLISIVFVGLIALPMIIGLSQPDLEISQAEKRHLAQWPRWEQREDLKSWFADISKYTADQFGLREKLIFANTKLNWLLGYSPSKKVIRGKDDWLFLNILDPLLSQHPWGIDAVQEGLKNRAKYVKIMKVELEKRGIPYQMIVASNKMTVYREHLPAKFSLTNVSASYEYYKSQFQSAELDEQILTDKVLTKLKSEYENSFYYKNDTHWNHLGAYMVFKESIKRLEKSNPAILFDMPDKHFYVKEKQTGDLSSYMGLGDSVLTLEPFTRFRPCAKRSKIERVDFQVSKCTCNRNNTVVFMVGDSFMSNLEPFYTESIGTMYIIKKGIARKRLLTLVDQLKPDLVIEEVVERDLLKKVSG